MCMKNILIPAIQIQSAVTKDIPVASSYPYLPRQSRWSTLRIVKCKSRVGFNIF